MQLAPTSTSPAALTGTLPIAPGPAGDRHAGWTPLPELVGRRRAPWEEKTLIETTADAAALSVVARYDRNGDGRLDPKTESTVEDIHSYWANADGSNWSGYTNPQHLAFVRSVSSIKDLLVAADETGYERPVQAAELAAVFTRFDTNGNGKLEWNDANGGAQMHQFFGDLTRTVGERTISAERSITPA